MSATARTQIGGEGTNSPKVFTATANPTADNDFTNGALPGDIWVQTTTPTVLVCISNGLGAAVWQSGVPGAFPGTAVTNLTDNSAWAASNTLAAISTTKTAHADLGAVAAATTSGKATQKDISAGGGTMAALVQPDVPRNVKLTITDGDASISAYAIAVVGTAQDGTTLTENFTFANGLTPAGSKIFASLTSVTISGLTGNGASDTVDLGYGVKLGVPIPVGATSLSIRKLTVNAASDTVAATDTTNNSFTTTTAADGSKPISVWFTYVDPATVAIANAVASLAAKVNAIMTADKTAGVLS